VESHHPVNAQGAFMIGSQAIFSQTVVQLPKVLAAMLPYQDPQDPARARLSPLVAYRYNERAKARLAHTRVTGSSLCSLSHAMPSVAPQGYLLFRSNSLKT